MEYRYTSTLSLTSALYGAGGQRYAPAALLPEVTRYPMNTRLGGPQGRSGQARKISPTPRIRFPVRSTRSQSLYRLCCLGPQTCPCASHKAYTGLTLAVHGGERSVSCPGRFDSQGKAPPRIHETEDWTDSRACLRVSDKKRNLLFLPELGPQIV